MPYDVENRMVMDSQWEKIKYDREPIRCAYCDHEFFPEEEEYYDFGFGEMVCSKEECVKDYLKDHLIK